MSAFTVTRATVDDAPDVLALIKRAFRPVAEEYGDPELPPLVETLESHTARYATSVVLKALASDGTIVGTVQGAPLDDGGCHVGRLAVDPSWQGRGVGRALTLALEAELPDVRRFELFTGHLSGHTVRLYRSLNYVETHRQHVAPHLTLVWLEKRR